MVWKVIVLLACAKILPIAQDAMLRNTTPAHAIQVTSIPLLVELTGSA